MARILLATTAMDRWGATRRMTPREVPQGWFVLLGILAMLVLLVLLIALSYWRRQRGPKPPVETFAGNAQRAGLSARERQILLAVALRSGLSNTSDIFHEIRAFHQGTAQLLAECERTRTPPEIENLKAEIARLQLKLGFQKATGGAPAMARARAATREIRVGSAIELLSQQARAAAPVRGAVVRNDELEFAVALEKPRESKPGEVWVARCSVGLSAWEFRTATVSGDGQRLVLMHSGEIRVVERRHFPRVAVHWPALVAHVPLVRNERQDAGASDALTAYAPAFVAGTVTELAGPGLRVETQLQVCVDDRVLVLFQIPEGCGGAAGRRPIVTSLGWVRHGRELAQGGSIPDAIDRIWEGADEPDWRAGAGRSVSLAVELVGLREEEIEDLAAITDELIARLPDPAAPGATEGKEKRPPVLTVSGGKD